MDSKSLQIKIYLLERNEAPLTDEWAKVVIAAVSEKDARELANQSCKSEGYVWTDGLQVSAKCLGMANEDVDGIILFSRE